VKTSNPTRNEFAGSTPGSVHFTLHRLIDSFQVAPDRTLAGRYTVSQRILQPTIRKVTRVSVGTGILSE
jgi:hypothetical protein